MIARALNRLGSLTLVTSIGLGSLVSACSSSNPSTGGNGGNGTTTTSSTTSTTTSSSTGTGGSSAAPSFVAPFDATKSQMPEGLYVAGSKAYVGWAVLGQIKTVDLPSGTISDFGSIPTPPANGGFMLGIVTDAAGDVYVGFGGGPGTMVKNGVYKIPAAGGAVQSPWASDPAMSFANGLIFDAQDNLFVADSGGFIFKIAPSGTVSQWLADPSLAPATGCSFAAPFPVGANGIVQRGGAFYVSNTNVGQIVKVPINPDGTAGTPSIFAGPDCDTLGGIDGIALDTDGSIFGVVNTQSRIVRIGTDGKVTKLFEGKPLDNPASTWITTVNGKKDLYITNAAFFDTKTPAPGLLAYPLP